MSESTSIETTDRIQLVLPGRTRLRGVATLVVGGVGSRLDLPYEKVDDLQLAILSVLAANDLETVTIDLEVDSEWVQVCVGPLPDGGSTDQGLRRVLERLVDEVEPVHREQAGSEREEPASREWIMFRLARAGRDSA